MEPGNSNEAFSFYELKWDTKFFGVKCAKAVLYSSITPNQWSELKDKFSEYQFISIENRDSNPQNTQLIGRETSAFLADTNIQFTKSITDNNSTFSNIKIHQAYERRNEIVELADFGFSKFIEDTELAKRGGEQVYRQWVINSFDKEDKYFAISKDDEDNINGFLLHSYSNNTCIIELIAVSEIMTNSGVGKSLFYAVEYSALNKGIKEIKVGTQVRNLRAVNFYHRVGCKQVGCHQVYHLWNLEE